jgi:twitching motility two-component system response regulator PilH
MDTLGPTDRISRDIEDLVRRIGQHRTMMAQMAAVQAQALNELKGLLKIAGGLPAGGTTPAEVDEEIRVTALVGDLVSGRAGLPSGPARPTPKVLLVDDDPTTRNLISHFLRKENFIVDKAAGGSDGLAKARSGRPDLLIVDAAVSGMDGFEFLSLLKRDPETSRIPVLMLSSLDEEEAVVKSLDEGADYVIKPFSPRILVAKIKKTLKDATRHAVDHRPL